MEMELPGVEMDAPTLEMERPTRELEGVTLEMEVATLEMQAPTLEMEVSTLEMERPGVKFDGPTLEMERPIPGAAAKRLIAHTAIMARMRWTIAGIIEAVMVAASVQLAKWSGAPLPPHPNPPWVDAFLYAYCALVFAGMIWFWWKHRTLRFNRD